MTSQHTPFLVDVESLRARAEALGLDLPLVIWDESCASTNDALATLVHHPAEVAQPSAGNPRDLAGSPGDATALPEFTVLGTDFQNAGHGRLGRTWTVPRRKSLTFSLLLRPAAGAETWGWIPLVAGEAVRSAVAEAGVPAVLKWPNDVLTVDGKKLCGILARIEILPSGPRIVLGIGVNTRLDTSDLPREDASSLALELGVEGSEIDHEALLLSILKRLIPAVKELAEYGDEDFSRSQGAERVRAGMVTLGTRVKVERPDGSHLIGRATGLDTTGDLIIDDQISVSAGDVHHLRPAPEGSAGDGGNAGESGAAEGGASEGRDADGRGDDGRGADGTSPGASQR